MAPLTVNVLMIISGYIAAQSAWMILAFASIRFCSLLNANVTCQVASTPNVQ